VRALDCIFSIQICRLGNFLPQMMLIAQHSNINLKWALYFVYNHAMSTAVMLWCIASLGSVELRKLEPEQ
jgi:hypothetical protein